MSSAIQDLLAILDLEPIEVNLFRGRSPQQGWQRVFGGQVIGQALVAACRTVEDIAGRPPHSLHAYFLLAGDPKVPIVYEVDRIRHGRSFTTRRVVAIQHGHAIFSMAVSFHVEEPGLTHQARMPEVPGPEQLPSDADIRDRVLPMMPDSVRRYDHHRRRLLLSELLGDAGRAFAIAYQLALAEQEELLARLVERAQAPDGPTRRLLKVSLANYLAAATMMPYEAFRESCEQLAYDLELIGARFGASFEQVCHRLTTLSRPTSRGVPFFMLRVDAAGNISKRFAGASFPFSRFGGSCPRWRVHEAFRTPGRVVTQVVETPDGARYFTLARTAPRVTGPYADEDAGLAIGLGCELKYAQKLVYARGLDLANPAVTEIGPACRVCERPACAQRAAEPLGRTLTVDDFTKSISPYPFAAV